MPQETFSRPGPYSGYPLFRALWGCWAGARGGGRPGAGAPELYGAATPLALRPPFVAAILVTFKRPTAKWSRNKKTWGGSISVTFR